MRKSEYSAENDADAAHDDVGDAHERVLAAHHGSSGQNDRLGAVKLGHREVCSSKSVASEVMGQLYGHTMSNVQLISPRLHGLIVISQSQLAESGQPSRAHPDLKFFILLQIRRRVILSVVIRVFLVPVWWRHDLVPLVFGRLV